MSRVWERRKALVGLRFELGGEDRTGADARLTQALIEQELRVGLLSRAVFHGQADITSLLEARPLTSCCALSSTQSLTPTLLLQMDCCQMV